MDGPKPDAPRAAEAAPLERPEQRSEVVCYFQIDFDRCVIKQGCRPRTAGALSVRGPRR